MKKILSKIRTKSPQFRFFLSVWCALVVTLLIVVGYILVERASPSTQQSAPSPFNALVGSIKGSVSSGSPQQTQVIDASQAGSPDGTNSSNDETNPFVDQSANQNAPVAASTDQTSTQ